MSDSFNALNPRNDLSCPNLNRILNDASKREGKVIEKRVEDADVELSQLLEIIKAQREQMERTERAMVEYAARDKKHVDQLCDIRDRLKDGVSDKLGTPTSHEAIRAVLKKHFSLDLSK